MDQHHHQLNGQGATDLANAFTAFLRQAADFANRSQQEPAGQPHPDDVDDDMPPLEPINPQTTNNNVTIAPLDEEMPPLEPVPPTVSSGVAVNGPSTRRAREDDEDSMPDLQSVSDSSGDEVDESDDSEQEQVEVEMMDDVQPVDDDHDPDWTDDDGPPPLERNPRGSRRARVDDDQDQDRDLRHPSERVANTPPPRTGQGHGLRPNLPPTFTGFGRNRRGDLDPLTIFQRVFNARVGGTPGQAVPGPAHPQAPAGQQPQGVQGAAQPGANSAPNANNAPPNNPPNFFAGGIAMVVDRNGNFVPMPFQVPGGPAPPNGGAGAPPQGFHFGFDGGAGGGQGGFDFTNFAEFIQRFGAEMGAGMMDEREDPERAKRLVAGLEEVPVGLIKRMGRVGGAPGSHVDETGGVEVPGCAVCWDQLLDAENDGFEHNASNALEPQATEEQANCTDSSKAKERPEQPKIVSLPCAHVFHAKCLVPWFSRPRQTTCPTCRFNIDPDNLTYVRRPPPPRPAPGNVDVPPPAHSPAPAGAVPAHAPPPPPPPPPPNAHSDGPVPNFDFLFHDHMHEDHDDPDIPDMPPVDEPPPNPFQGQDGLPPPPGFGDFVTLDFNITINGAPPPGNGGNGQGNVPTPTDFLQMLLQQQLSRNPNAAAAGNGAGMRQPQGGGAPTPGNTRNAPQTGNAPPQGNGPNGPAPPPFTFNFPVGPPPPPTPNGGAGNGGAAPPPFTFGQFPLFGDAPPFTARGPRRNGAPVDEKREWTVPPPPGPTLRQRVEEKEREAGLRCFDVSCGIGPSDEDPLPDVDTTQKRLSIKADIPGTDGPSPVCVHTFHPACFVSAERVAGWGANDEESGGDVEVSCSVCRAVGHVTREEWAEGVKALE